MCNVIVYLRIRCSYLQHGAPPRDAWSLHAAAGDDNGLHLLLHMQLLHMAVHVLLPLVVVHVVVEIVVGTLVQFVLALVVVHMIHW